MQIDYEREGVSTSRPPLFPRCMSLPFFRPPRLRRVLLVSLALALAALPLRLPAAPDAPVSPGALPGVTAQLQLFHNLAGRLILSGQQEIAWSEPRHQEDFDYIIQNTGRTPAVRGFDFLKYVESPASRASQAATPRAIAWARSGGIVTFCVHMFMNLGSTNGTPQFYTPGANGNPVGTNFDIRQAVIAGTPENAEFLAKLDVCAEELKLLRDAGVTVLWRPFHECGGTWFWWSRHGAEPFKAAWRIMFARYTQVHGLTNLVWCFNPVDSTTVLSGWYPGDDVVDVISLDVYPPAGTHPTYSADYRRMRDFTGGRKPVVLSENGSIPDIDALFAEGGGWGYFCTWNGFENDLTRHSVAFLNAAFNHAKVVTLDELGAVYGSYAAAVTVDPLPAPPAPGANVALTASSLLSPAPAYQWRRNGALLAGETNLTLNLPALQPAATGLYAAHATSGTTTAASAAVIVGLATTAKVTGGGTELDPHDIRHPNGNTFDQVLLTGNAAAITAEYSPDPSLNQVTRLSYVDLDDDIVQVEFSGPGTLSLVLDSPTGPALPVNYNQAVNYMKGHAGIVVTGATAKTFLAVFSVGRATAFDPTGAFDLTQPASATNNPAANGNPIFQAGTSYGGRADLAFIAITSTDGRCGGLLASNVNFFASRGLTGVYAPGVAFDRFFVGEVTAFDTAAPALIAGSATDARITGGDLLQDNGAPLRIGGFTQLRFTAGADSHGTGLPARANRATLLRNGLDVTAQVAVNP